MVSGAAIAEGLLAGPRGRRLCLEFARPHPRLAEDGVDPLADALFLGAFERDEGSVTLVRYSTSGADGGRDDGRIPSAPPVEEIARLLEASPLPVPTETMLADCLEVSVGSARYWQEPDGTDVLAAEPELWPALRRAAHAIVGSAPAAWWGNGIDRSDQWAVTFDGTRDGTATPAREALDVWRATVQRDEAQWRQYEIGPGIPMGGPWWSIPPRALLRTSSSPGGRGLRFVEDGLGWSAAEVRQVQVADSAHVFEITSADDWAELCRRYPLDVTASRRHDWARATSRDGAWVIPDWARVADDYDAVHLTVAGYLNAATRAIPVDEESSSVVGGWDPDQTVWLRDGVAVTGKATRWAREDDGEWRSQEHS
jgi:hypothetical protein